MSKYTTHLSNEKKYWAIWLDCFLIFPLKVIPLKKFLRMLIVGCRGLMLFEVNFQIMKKRLHDDDHQQSWHYPCRFNNSNVKQRTNTVNNKLFINDNNYYSL